jgi:hypothetical protein
MPSSSFDRSAAILLIALSSCVPVRCQDNSKKLPGTENMPAKSLSNPQGSQPGKLLVKDATPIKMKLKRGVYSQYAKVGDAVDYLVDEELVLDGKTIVPENSIVVGKVVSAEHKRTMGRGGKIDISADSIKLFNGQSIPLRAFQHARGGGQGLDMSGEMLAAASLTLGVGAPFVLFKHGKDIEIRQGSSFTAFVNGDVWLDDIAFQLKSSPAVPVPPAPVSGTSKNADSPLQMDRAVAVSISSSPVGAEIIFDGSFVGNTPETLKILPGDHLVVLQKQGYKVWQRKLKVVSEIVNVTVELAPETK